MVVKMAKAKKKVVPIINEKEQIMKLNEFSGMEPEARQKKANRDIFMDYLPYFIIILIVLIIRTYIATPIRVNGSSMDTTLKNGETLLLNKLGMKTNGINRWDIIVIKIDDSYLIKRVIALPGETIKYEDGELFINDKPIKDKYSLTKTDDFEEVKVGSDEYFVMGDNRGVSQDSRVLKPINKSYIKGKTNIIIFPIDRFGKIE